MGILPMPEPTDNKKSAAAKRKSRQLDFSTLGPLKSKEGTVGFAGYRDASSKSSIPKMKNGQRSKDEDDMDSDIDEGTALGPKTTSNNQSKAAEDDGDTGEDINHNLTAEELAKRAELADGVKKMQVRGICLCLRDTRFLLISCRAAQKAALIRSVAEHA